MSSTKRCSACGETKPLDAFNRDKNGQFGRYAYCRECHRERRRAYYSANRDRELERSRAYYDANRDRYRNRYRAWYAANCDRRREYTRAWREANPDRAREQHRRRRARKRAATVEEFSPADVYAWWDELGAYTCFWCGLPFAEGDRIHVDHVWPLSRGGHHAVRNLVPTCERCNQAKHASLPHEFAERAYREWLTSTSG